MTALKKRLQAQGLYIVKACDTKWDLYDKQTGFLISETTESEIKERAKFLLATVELIDYITDPDEVSLEPTLTLIKGGKV